MLGIEKRDRVGCVDMGSAERKAKGLRETVKQRDFVQRGAACVFRSPRQANYERSNILLFHEARDIVVLFSTFNRVSLDATFRKNHVQVYTWICQCDTTLCDSQESSL